MENFIPKLKKLKKISLLLLLLPSLTLANIIIENNPIPGGIAVLDFDSNKSNPRAFYKSRPLFTQHIDGEHWQALLGIPLWQEMGKIAIAFQSNCVHFWWKTMDYMWGKLSKMSHFKNCELSIPSGRVFSGLPENHKIIQIGPTELKLWPLNYNSRHIHVLVSWISHPPCGRGSKHSCYSFVAQAGIPAVQSDWLILVMWQHAYSFCFLLLSFPINLIILSVCSSDVFYKKS